MERIQRQRTKGWRMPADAVYVGRPTRWGNPFTLAQHSPQEACQLFEQQLQGRPQLVADAHSVLSGKRLACWCRLDQPCHADTWLRVLAQPPT